MDLSDFIKEVISSIENGVKDTDFTLKWNNQHDSWWIEFDLSVSIEKSDWIKWNWKISVLPFINLWAEKDLINKEISYSRIKFKIDTPKNVTFI